MYIISKTINGSGSYPALQSWTSPNCPDTHYFYPDEFFDLFYPKDKQCAGFITYEANDEAHTVTSVTWNDEAYDAYIASLPAPYVPTNSEKRKQAYETGYVDGDETSYKIEYDGKEYTVDELTALGEKYRFRGETEKADEITAAIKVGVEKIRTAYPDEEAVVSE